MVSDSCSFEVLVAISSPKGYQNWSPKRQLRRLTAVLEWHDYIQGLHRAGKVRYAWGSHQLLSRATFCSSTGVLVAVYKVQSWAEFDRLLVDDPLRDCSLYITTPLSPLLEDREADLQRYERHLDDMLAERGEAVRARYERERASYCKPPDYVGRFPYVQPPNPPMSLDRHSKPGDPLQVLLLGINPPQYVGSWNDMRKLVHHEKVTWWHDYMSMMIQQGKVKYAWGTHDFCVIEKASSNACGAVAIYEVGTMAEFDDVYKLDPIRTDTLFWSVLLQPLADQRTLDEQRLLGAQSRVSPTTFARSTAVTAS